ncbi:MAG: catalase-peroxidase [Gemmatimonadetes bacterium]|nr:catalase-peroxidase [Gemmatimonadota bacterium]
MDGKNSGNGGKCPVPHGAPKATAVGGRSNRDWWPEQLDLGILHQHSPMSDPMGEAFDYAAEFKTLDLEAVSRASTSRRSARTSSR